MYLFLSSTMLVLYLCVLDKFDTVALCIKEYLQVLILSLFVNVKYCITEYLTNAMQSVCDFVDT